MNMRTKMHSWTVVLAIAGGSLALSLAQFVPAHAEIDADSIITLPKTDAQPDPGAETNIIAPPEERKQDASVEPRKERAAPQAAQAAAETNASGNAVKQKRKKDVVAKKQEPPKVEPKPYEPVPFLFGLFDARLPEPAQLSEDQVNYDEAALALLKKKPPKIDERFQKVAVPFSGYQPGTVVIDTKKKFLYFVQSPTSAIRYGVAVGKEGLQFTGKVAVGAKQVWPRWIPTKEMIERDPRHYAQYVEGMDGGPDNPLGARAIYLYLGRQDTHLRIHGTNQPNSIGSEASNGCFRMLNEHVIELYDKVKLGAPVVVI